MLEIDDINIGYGKRPVLCHITAKARPGEVTALFGKNGSGKSTLLKSVASLVKPVSGTIRICGRTSDSLSRKEAARTVSFTGTEKIRIPGLECRDLVSMGRAPWTDWTGRLRAHDRKIIGRALELAGMSDFASVPSDSVSDGEMQKILIARALAQDTPVMLLDEPTAFLDVPGKYQIFGILRKLADRERKTIVVATHDIGYAMAYADNIWLIDNGRVTCMAVSDPETLPRIRAAFNPGQDAASLSGPPVHTEDTEAGTRTEG